MTGTWHEIDGFMTRVKYRKTVTSTWTARMSDHLQKAMRLRIQARETPKPHKGPQPIACDRLHEPKKAEEYNKDVESRLQGSEDIEAVLKAMEASGQQICGKKAKSSLNPWMEGNSDTIKGYQRRIQVLTAKAKRGIDNAKVERNKVRSEFKKKKE